MLRPLLSHNNFSQMPFSLSRVGMTSARSLVCSSQQQWLRSVSNSSHGSSSDESKINTGILHFGIGRFFRAHGAVYIQTLLNAGKEKNNGWGICGVCILPSDRFIYDSLKAQGCKYTLMERDAKGEAVKTIDSIKKVLHGHQDPAAVFDAMLNKDVKLITCTVTEAGYYFGASKSLDMSDPLIQHDLEYPSTPKTIYGYLAHGLHLRHQQNLPPITVQSCDNIQGNGDLFQKLMLEFCGKVYPSLVPVIEAGEKVSFPNSMVDRITPAASPEELVYVKEKLRVEDDAVPVTAESYTQWVVEDKYCGERPPWEEIGVQVTTSVKPYEKIKVRLLNGGHLALGYAGVLAGFDTVCNVTSDRTFQRYLRGFFRQVEETLEPVPQMDLSEYQESLVSRFTNPAIGDHLERICKDGSAKIPGFILAALRELLASHKPTSHVSFVLASYMRYLTVLVGRGEEADDPQSDSLLALAASADGKAQVFLSDELLFGDIGQNQALVREVQSHYDSICSKGMMVSLQELNGSE